MVGAIRGTMNYQSWRGAQSVSSSFVIPKPILSRYPNEIKLNIFRIQQIMIKGSYFELGISTEKVSIVLLNASVSLILCRCVLYSVPVQSSQDTDGSHLDRFSATSINFHP